MPWLLPVTLASLLPLTQDSAPIGGTFGPLWIKIALLASLVRLVQKTGLYGWAFGLWVVLRAGILAYAVARSDDGPIAPGALVATLALSAALGAAFFFLLSRTEERFSYWIVLVLGTALVGVFG